MMIILALTTTMVLVSLARPHRVGDAGATSQQYGALSPVAVEASTL